MKFNLTYFIKILSNVFIMDGIKNNVSANLNNYDEYDYLTKLLTIDGQTIVGPPGPQGPPGQSDTIVIGITSTLAPSSAATVVDTQTSTATGTQHSLAFGIPQGIQGPQGEKGEKGEKGNTGASTLEAMAAAAEATAAASAASASASAAGVAAGQSAAYADAAEAAAASINGEFEGRVSALETKTQFQNSFTDINLDQNTDFDGYLNVKSNSGSNGIVLNGNSKKISCGNTTIENNIVTSNTIYTNTIDAGDSFSDLNIGKYSGLNINIGNPILASSVITRNVINLYGKVNFSNDDIVGNFFQF